MKRCIDFVAALFAIVVLFIPLIVIACLVRMTSSGPVINWSDRVGRHNRIFRMAKYRSMHLGTPQVATHLLDDPENYITSVGRFLRKTSLDELPQLWCVLKGDMSLVGPRPALFNQQDLIDLRTERGVHKLRPGVTGWAQVNGRDAISIDEKVALDEEYMRRSSLGFDIKILWMTITNLASSNEIAH